MLKDDDFKLLRGFEDELTDRQTDISECRFAFVTESIKHIKFYIRGLGGVGRQFSVCFHLNYFLKVFVYLL